MDIKELDLSKDKSLYQAGQDVKEALEQATGQKAKIVGYRFYCLLGNETLGCLGGWANGFKPEDYED